MAQNDTSVSSSFLYAFFFLQGSLWSSSPHHFPLPVATSPLFTHLSSPPPPYSSQPLSHFLLTPTAFPHIRMLIDSPTDRLGETDSGFRLIVQCTQRWTKKKRTNIRWIKWKGIAVETERSLDGDHHLGLVCSAIPLPQRYRRYHSALSCIKHAKTFTGLLPSN